MIPVRTVRRDAEGDLLGIRPAIATQDIARPRQQAPQFQHFHRNLTPPPTEFPSAHLANAPPSKGANSGCRLRARRALPRAGLTSPRGLRVLVPVLSQKRLSRGPRLSAEIARVLRRFSALSEFSLGTRHRARA